MAKKFTEKDVALLEQNYFCFDKPVPFKDLLIYPVLVKDYYKFHSCIQIFTLKKNEDYNPQCISMSNLGYAIYKIKEENSELDYSTLMIGVLELIFHIKNGIYCENCRQKNEDMDFIAFDELWDSVYKLEKKEEKKAYLEKQQICSHCGQLKREVISIKEEKNKESLCVYNTEINKNDYDFLYQVVLYQNLPTWEDIEYADLELKKELEERQKILGDDTVPPTLEKQMAVIVAQGCNYKFEEIYDLSLRKLSVLISNIDKMIHYQIYKTSSMSGLVTFNSEIEHYLYCHKRKSATDDVFTLESFQKKMERVT